MRLLNRRAQARVNSFVVIDGHTSVKILSGLTPRECSRKNAIIERFAQVAWFESIVIHLSLGTRSSRSFFLCRNWSLREEKFLINARMICALSRPEIGECRGLGTLGNGTVLFFSTL